ncbi:hypothetical protein EVG20_g10986 [Dentipellis fragilis]|uniref:Uncharacterized protein n=1 Tax=Dentipellis fragilis TaxID=205917 RepID=A0A4Y9XMF5_9AGAM|nr:hypothetical protein EVG20_g10986 [Dentipellis fragilis]
MVGVWRPDNRTWARERAIERAHYREGEQEGDGEREDGHVEAIRWAHAQSPEVRQHELATRLREGVHPEQVLRRQPEFEHEHVRVQAGPGAHAGDEQRRLEHTPGGEGLTDLHKGERYVSGRLSIYGNLFFLLSLFPLAHLPRHGLRTALLNAQLLRAHTMHADAHCGSLAVVKVRSGRCSGRGACAWDTSRRWFITHTHGAYSTHGGHGTNGAGGTVDAAEDACAADAAVAKDMIPVAASRSTAHPAPTPTSAQDSPTRTSCSVRPTSYMNSTPPFPLPPFHSFPFPFPTSSGTGLPLRALDLPGRNIMLAPNSHLALRLRLP